MAEENGLGDILSGFLSSPDAMEKINAVLSGLSQNGGDGAPFDTSALQSMIAGMGNDKSSGHKKDNNAGDFPVETVMRLANAYKEISKKEDPRVTLLRALVPYLNDNRKEKAETAIKILSLVQLAPLLGDLGKLNLF